MPQALVRDTAKVSGLTVLSKVAGALKTIVIARYFGAAGVLDTYLLAFLPVSFLIDVVSGSMINALLPAFVDTSERDGRNKALALYGSVQIRILGVLLGVGAILAVFAGPLLHILATGFDDEKIRLTRDLMFIMLPILPLSALNVCWRALLNAEEHFAVAAISPALVPVFTVVALMILTNRYGIFALAIGTVAGAIAESLLLLLCVRASGAPSIPGPHHSVAGTSSVFAQYFPSAGGNLVMSSSALVDQSMAAMLGSGSVSILNYGTRLVTVVLAIGPAALSTVILPWFSRLAAKGDSREVRRTIVRYSLLSLAVTIPLTLVLVEASKWLIELLFQRGAFTTADTGSVARVQAYALLRIPLSVLLALLLPMVASLKRNSLLLVVAVFSVTANVVFNLVFMRTLGVAGLALSTAVVHLLAVVFLANRLLANPGKATFVE
jgi:putative peptidoglycan lipid II flippase